MSDTIAYSLIGAVIVFVLTAVLTTLFQLSKQVGGIDRKVSRIANHLGIDPTAPLPLSDRVKEIARDPHRKIEAIKVYREETGVGLAEAKDAVEAYQLSLGR